jgi:hypothetical protein
MGTPEQGPQRRPLAARLVVLVVLRVVVASHGEIGSLEAKPDAVAMQPQKLKHRSRAPKKRATAQE